MRASAIPRLERSGREGQGVGDGGGGEGEEGFRDPKTGEIRTYVMG